MSDSNDLLKFKTKNGQKLRLRQTMSHLCPHDDTLTALTAADINSSEGEGCIYCEIYWILTLGRHLIAL